MIKIGNFGATNIKTVYPGLGWRDLYSCDKSTFDADGGEDVKKNRQMMGTEVSGVITYDFIIVPCHGFLASPDLLLNNCELRINFDRADSRLSTIRIDGSDPTPKIEIKNCFAKTEYVSSPELRQYFEQISLNPIVYMYEDVNVIAKPCPKNLNTIRFDNIRSSTTPKFIFFGIIDADSLTGSEEKSPTYFQCNGVEEASIYYNGNLVPGYPIKTESDRAVPVLHQFNDVTGRYLNTLAEGSINYAEFEFNYIWSHKMEAETVNGSFSIELTLKTPFNSNKTLVVWIITENVLSIDKDHIIEKLQ